MKQINIVKIWSESVEKERIKLLWNWINSWSKKTWEWFIIVSSWAKALWEDEVIQKWWDIELFSKSWLCAIWQSLLMNLYKEIFSQDVLIAQILVDDWQNESFILWLLERFKNHKRIISIIWKLISYLNREKDKHLIQTLDKLISQEVICIINHNDTLSSQELSKVSQKTDNDLNVVYICKIVSDFQKEIDFRIKRIIYLTNTNWLLDQNWNTVSGWEISNIEEKRSFYKWFIKTDEKSKRWTWWMWSKIDGCFDWINLWVKEAIIANSENWLWCLEWKWNFTKFSN